MGATEDGHLEKGCGWHLRRPWEAERQPESTGHSLQRPGTAHSFTLGQQKVIPLINMATLTYASINIRKASVSFFSIKWTKACR